ncbi:unnamed protein product [Notodromas monacha]|uniref:NFX1-type zinc finger-containing protein 1 n=1 Tax=Notodromas monacha TaxID=399045 RepID=A0A7R9GHH5_9CRUS|nr:unnamed protein product [Notodromas monacha]CAG0921345.1 unnamed protein product [Notodromas monacha]
MATVVLEKLLQQLSLKESPERVKISEISAKATDVGCSSGDDDEDVSVRKDVSVPDFRKLTIVPRASDLLEDCDYPVPVNKVTEPYSSCDEYLDTHFRLTRENFVRPLKEAVQNHVKGENAWNRRIYQDVSMQSMWCSRNRIGLLMKFNVEKLKGIYWEESKFLTPGSLLCLSCDGFKSMHFVTVYDRNSLMAAKGLILVMLESPGVDELNLAMWKTNDWVAVESPGYFLAIRHVLHNLQTVQFDQYPIAKCVLGFEGGFEKPGYLEMFLSMSKRLTIPAKHSSLPDISIDFSQDSRGNWPDNKGFGLDNSQLEALKCGLLNQVAVIQGPPGCGKTYVGLKLVKAMLANRAWGNRSPILVICYTNHALDQFLEGILKFTKRVARIGGRSKSALLEKYNIREWLQTRSLLQRKIAINVRPYTPAQNLLLKVMTKKKKLQKKIQMDFIYQTILSSGAGIVKLRILDPKLVKKSKTSTMKWLGIQSGLTVPETLVNEILDAERQQVEAVYGASGREKFLKSLNFKQWDDFGETRNGAGSSTGEDASHVEYEATVLRAQRDIDEWYDIEDDEEGDISLYCIDKEERKKNAFLQSLLFETSVTRCREIIAVANEEIQDLQEKQKAGKADLEEAKRAARGNRWKMVAFEHLKDSYEAEWLQSESTINVLKKEIVDADKLIITLKSVIKLLRVPDSVQLPPPKIKLPTDAVQLNNMRLKDKWLLYRYLVSLRLTERRNAMAELAENYRKAVQKMEDCRSSLAVDVMSAMDVIGMTTTAASRDISKLSRLNLKIVVVEEAAEVFESSIITSLTRSCEHLVLIGDHKQLRPKADVVKLAQEHRMDVSLFERLVKNKFPFVQLEMQHRMRPEIANLIRPHVYRRLFDHASVKNYPNVPGIAKNVFCVTHEMKESLDSKTKSMQNKWEAEYLLALCQYLLQQGIDSGRITILSPYSRQIRNLSEHREQYPLTKHVYITTVDNFQGEECDIILLSLVRSNDDNVIGFLGNMNRVNVALSRAKHGLYIVGNMKMLSENAKIWEDVRDSMEKSEAIGPALPLYCSIHKDGTNFAKSPEDFRKHGGCDQLCGQRLSCGHKCTRICHAYDRAHMTEEMSCTEPVKRLCSRGLHSMRYLCGTNVTGICRIFYAGVLACGHESSNIPCICLDASTSAGRGALESPRCEEPCGRMFLKCQHECGLNCAHILQDALDTDNSLLHNSTYQALYLKFGALNDAIHSDWCPQCLVKVEIGGLNRKQMREKLADLVFDCDAIRPVLFRADEPWKSRKGVAQNNQKNRGDSGSFDATEVILQDFDE